MKKFLFLYTSPVSAEELMANAKPDEMQKSMQPWIEWFNKVGEGLIDRGGPLGNPQHVTSSGVTSGSLKVMGYTLLEAEDMDKAVELAKAQPHLQMGEGTSVEVLEMLAMPGV